MKKKVSLAGSKPTAGYDPSATIGRNIEPFLLLELLQEPSYGYDLIRRLAGFGFRRAIREPGVVYKVLRALEDNALIRSKWSTRESGPARRYYEITEQGRASLHTRVYHLTRHVDRIHRLLSKYTAITGENPGTEPFPKNLPGEEVRLIERMRTES